MKITVSVIIPIYNGEKFLDETIQSILKQTNQDFEIILVNDGSTDNTENICLKYTGNEKVKYFKQLNSGVSKARNFGLEKANGDYIFFMDADDTIESNFIETSINIAIKKASDVIILGEYYYKRFKLYKVLPTWAMIINKKFLDENSNIRYPENIQPCEDGIFSHEILLKTNKISFNRSAIYNYRKHDNQNLAHINNQCEKFLKQIPIWFEILNKYYKENDFFKTKSIEYLGFLFHEPFELRYLNMPFNDIQKKELHKIIKKQFDSNLRPHIKTTELINKYFDLFIFLNINNLKIFDRYYIIKLKIHLFYINLKFKLINLIPISGIRKKLRNKMREKLL